MKRAKVTLVPLVVAVAAFFVVLPRTGGDAVVVAVESGSGFAFSPLKATVGAGTRIRFDNETRATHSIESLTGAFALGDLQAGESTFLEHLGAGTYEFRCRYHGNDGMTGELAVS